MTMVLIDGDTPIVGKRSELTSAPPKNEAATVVHLQRHRLAGQFSIEGLFQSLRHAIREHGYEVVSVVAPYPSQGLWRRLANIAWAWRHRNEICHITGDVHFLAFGLPRNRTILTIHDCFPLDRFQGVKQWALRKLWFDWPIRRSAAVTVISETTKRRLLEHVRVPEAKIVVIPDAACSVFRPCPRPFGEDCSQILHVGTGANKNLPRLIEAIAGLNCRLKIIGVLSDELRCKLNDAGISFESAANLDEAAMYRAYCDADLVSFVSIYEGFGMPILEAQWVERPVVTSNCSSMPEVAGKGACLVDPFDVQSIRQGIVRVITDAAYRVQLIEEGRRNRERYTLEKVARQYIELYEKVARDAGC